MSKDFLREAISIIVGKQSEGIADLLDSKKPVNEFLIAKKLELTINQTRNLLYRITDQGLVSSIRKKDKKKGWYTYFWKIEPLKCLEFLRKILINKIEQTNYQINSRQTRRFYICEKCNLEFNEENALLCDFTCRECGNVLKLEDNTKLLKELKRNLLRFEGELEDIKEEIDREHEKEEKIKLRELKKKKAEKIKNRKLERSSKNSKKLKDTKENKKLGNIKKTKKLMKNKKRIKENTKTNKNNQKRIIPKKKDSRKLNVKKQKRIIKKKK
jgi:transcription factor E